MIPSSRLPGRESGENAHDLRQLAADSCDPADVLRRGGVESETVAAALARVKGRRQAFFRVVQREEQVALLGFAKFDGQDIAC